MAYQNCPFIVTPYDEASLIKPPKLLTLNYTNQDFWSMKARLYDYIRENFSQSFNDFVEADLAVMLIENWAYIADTLSFKMDQIANEIFIDTVSEVDNAFRLSKLMGFQPQPPIAARSMWSASMTTLLETDMTISTPISIGVTTEQGPKTIELFAADSENNPLFDQDIVISAGDYSTSSVIGLEGVTKEQTQIGNGEINQYFKLSGSPVIWNSVRVQVDGKQWIQVDYFTDSHPRQEFRIEYDSVYAAYVMFGNNQAGLIPSPGSNIVITYRVGGGVAGNIVTGAVQLQQYVVVPGFEYRLPVAFTNYTRGEYGYAGDGLSDIQRKLPPWLRLQNRVVSGSDYESFANQFVTEYHGQIAKSNAILRQYGCAANLIDLYVLARDGNDSLAETSSELKVDLQEALLNVKMITDQVCIKDGVVIEVDVTIDATMDKFYRKFEDEFRAKIQSRATSFFSLNNWDFGQILRAADLSREIADVKEVKTLNIDFQTDNENNSGEIVTTKFYEIIRPVSLEINFVYE